MEDFCDIWKIEINVECVLRTKKATGIECVDMELLIDVVVVLTVKTINDN